MCIHDGVSQFEQKEQVDSLCRSMTTSWVREQKKQEEKVDDLCPYFEGFEANGADVNLDGVFDINDLKQTGLQKTWCPYFLARHLINLANVVIFNYQYLIDPKIASLVSKELESECIVCFDEAHNIDNVCLEAYSVKLNKRTLVTSAFFRAVDCIVSLQSGSHITIVY
jgi:DNA excision repair protein ERCC-2